MSRSTHKTSSPSFRAKRGISFLFSLMLLLIFTLPASAQVTTGTPPFGSFGGSPEAINLANLNAHWSLPVLHKPGRGMNFTYDLSYDTSVWYKVFSNGTTTWQPANNWGWSGSTQAVTGLMSQTSTNNTCQVCNQYTCWYPTGQTVISNWKYTDSWGIPHSFSGSVIINNGQCPMQYGGPNSTGFTSTTSDGSGITLAITGSTNTTGITVVLTKSDGTVLNGPSGSSGSGNTDRNGNQITTDGSGHFYDTLSSTTPVLTVAGSGTAASPMIFTYTAPSTASAAYTMKYTSYSIQTNFGCTGIADYGTNGTTTANLVSEIDLPDWNASTNPNAKYTFAYEQTPGHTGFVTGRLTSVTLPTGGTINYAYRGGSSGNITCADGSAATLTRTTPDGIWTYAHSESGAAWNTLITDPQSNQTNMNFQGIYETQRQVSQLINGSQSLLRQWTTCYNGNTSSCNTTAITLPITQRTVTDQYGISGPQCQHIYKYNSAGGLTEQDDYDYPSGTALLRKILITFAPLVNITAFKQQVTVQNGSGTTISQTTYNYDEVSPTATSGIAQHVAVTGSRGNLTSINYPVSGLTSHFKYYDTGSPNTSQDVNSAITTYNYSSTNNAYCQMAFPTSVGEPLSISRFMTWNCTGGVPATSTDENSQVTSYTWNDPYFWRPAQVTFRDDGQTAWTYNSKTSTTTTTKMNSSQNIVTTQLLDGLGRNKQQQLNSDPEGVVYQDTTYDSLGRVYTVSNPYRSTSDPTYGLTTYGYDALSRPTAVTLQDGSVSNASYPNNTITATDPAGKKRTSTFDSLGRLTQVLEDPTGVNYETDYAYDALGNALCVAQKGTNTGTFSGCASIPASWRPRTFVYDALSRLTSETNPESGTVTYGYDASGHQGDLTSRVAPAPNQTGSSTVTTTYAYDLLHRLTSTSYSDGITPSDAYTYDISTKYGLTFQNPIGRMVLAERPCSTLSYSYDPMGRVLQNLQYTYLSCNGGAEVATLSYSYDLAGDMTAYTNGAGVTFTQTFDAAGRPTGLTSSLVDSQHPATLATTDSSVGYYSHGALRKMTYGNGLTQATSIERRLQPCRINLNSSGAYITDGCTDGPVSGTIQDFDYAYGGWGTTNNDSITTINAAGQQNFNRTYTYDSLNRLSTLSSPSDPNGCANLSWTYDAWGNRTDQGSTSSCPTFHQSANTQNQIVDTINHVYQYDAAGNMTADGRHTYTYDAEDRLIQVDATSGYCSSSGNTAVATACYVYDALGRRSVKIPASGVWTQYFYDLSSNVVAEFGKGCGPTCWATGYMYMNGSLLAEYANSTTYFIHPDHLGSTRLVTALNQSLAQNLDYLPYSELNSTDSGVTTHEFTGDERDAETASHSGGEDGLDHTWFRKYSSNLGRWMTPDPAGLAAVNPSNPQSWNRYSYVLNNPLALVDPHGLRPGCYSFFGPSCGDDSGGGFGCSEDGIDVGCGMVGTNGNTIFDAVRGAPGTYVTFDIYGNIGYGFSDQLWNATLNYIDMANVATHRWGSGPVPTAGYTVLIQSFGVDTVTSGFIPDLLLAAAQGSNAAGSPPTPPATMSAAWELYHLLMQGQPSTDAPLAFQLMLAIYPDVNQYYNDVGQWAAVYSPYIVPVLLNYPGLSPK
jgi:RHS repeat-associated protein